MQGFAARLSGLASGWPSLSGRWPAFRPDGLTAPEAVSRLAHCLRKPWSASAAGPRLVRRVANVGTISWGMNAGMQLASTPQTDDWTVREYPRSPPVDLPVGTRSGHVARSPISTALLHHLWPDDSTMPGTCPYLARRLGLASSPPLRQDVWNADHC